MLIEDAGVVVLGGLIQDSGTRSEQRVPFLGRIPLIGLAFKTRSAQNTKTNLMVFIRPKILRDGTSAAIETNSKYNYMRDLQRSGDRREVLPLLPGVKPPRLPPAAPLPDPADGAPAPASPAAAPAPGSSKPNPATPNSPQGTPE